MIIEAFCGLMINVIYYEFKGIYKIKQYFTSKALYSSAAFFWLSPVQRLPILREILQGRIGGQSCRVGFPSLSSVALQPSKP